MRRRALHRLRLISSYCKCWPKKLAKALNVNYVFIGEYDERGMGLPATVAFMTPAQS